MLLFSELRRFRLRDERGAEAQLVDLALDLSPREYPRVTRVLFRQSHKHNGEMAWEEVKSIDREARRIRVTDLSSARAIDADRHRRNALIGRDVMDALILDLPKRQSMRANDLWLEEEDGTLWLRAADISPWAVLRRVVHLPLGKDAAAQSLDWRDVELLRGDPQAAREGHDYHRRVAMLQPAEVARLLDAVPYLHATELLTLIPDQLAADALEVMRPERQAQIFEELDDQHRLRLLEQMAPENAADLLGRLGPEGAKQALAALPAERRDPIVDLLRYPEHSAAGIMTNQIVVVRSDLDVGSARRAIREELARPDFVYYVYAVDDAQSRHLEGVLTLRDLLLADDHTRVAEVMQHAVQTLDPLMPAREAAHRVADQHLAALPVVAKDRRILGAVTFDAALVQLAGASLVEAVPRVFT